MATVSMLFGRRMESNGGNTVASTIFPMPTPILQEKTVDPSSSSIITVTADQGYDGLSKVTVNKIIYNLEQLTVNPSIVTNTYYPSSQNIGFNQVVVNAVPLVATTFTTNDLTGEFIYPPSAYLGFSAVKLPKINIESNRIVTLQNIVQAINTPGNPCIFPTIGFDVMDYITLNLDTFNINDPIHNPSWQRIAYASYTNYYDMNGIYHTFSSPKNMYVFYPGYTGFYLNTTRLLIDANEFGNASPWQVLNNVIFSSNNGYYLKGTMPDRSNDCINIELTSEKTYYAGYYNDNWTITPGRFTGNADIFDVVENKTFWSSSSINQQTGAAFNCIGRMLRTYYANTVDQMTSFFKLFDSNNEFYSSLSPDYITYLEYGETYYLSGKPNSGNNSFMYDIRPGLTRSGVALNRTMIDDASYISIETGFRIAVNGYKAAGNATGAMVLSGYTFSNDNGTEFYGTMNNYGDIAGGISPGATWEWRQTPGYVNSITITASAPNIADFTGTREPSVSSFSSLYTNYMTVLKPSARDGWGNVNVNVPLLRDGTLFHVSGVYSWGTTTIYNGPDSTAESYSGSYIKVTPTGRNGWITNWSEAYIKPDAAFGNASSNMVLSGHKFTSADGFALSGSMQNFGDLIATVLPGSMETWQPNGYVNYVQITASAPKIEDFTGTRTPSVDGWSNLYTGYMTLSKPSSNDGWGNVKINVPFLRDGTLFQTSAVSSGSMTFYNGSESTAESYSGSYLRIAPIGRAGWIHPSSYAYMKPSTTFGNATRADVRNGKTFTSADGFALTGTMESGTFGNALSFDVLSGKTFTNASGAYNGSMPNLADKYLGGSPEYQVGWKNSGSVTWYDQNGTTHTLSVNAVAITLGHTGYISNSTRLIGGDFFGNAAKSEVVRNKTFTSTAGAKATGTLDVGVPHLLWKNPNVTVSKQRSSTYGIRTYTSSAAFAAQNVTVTPTITKELWHYLIIEFSSFSTNVSTANRNGSFIVIIDLGEITLNNRDSASNGGTDIMLSCTGLPSNTNCWNRRAWIKAWSVATGGGTIRFQACYQHTSSSTNNSYAIPIRIWECDGFPAVDVRLCNDDASKWAAR